MYSYNLPPFTAAKIRISLGLLPTARLSFQKTKLLEYAIDSTLGDSNVTILSIPKIGLLILTLETCVSKDFSQDKCAPIVINNRDSNKQGKIVDYMVYK